MVSFNVLFEIIGSAELTQTVSVWACVSFHYFKYVCRQVESMDIGIGDGGDLAEVLSV